MASLEKSTHFLQMPGDKTLVALNESHFCSVILGDDNLSPGFIASIALEIAPGTPRSAL